MTDRDVYIVYSSRSIIFCLSSALNERENAVCHLSGYKRSALNLGMCLDE